MSGIAHHPVLGLSVLAVSLFALWHRSTIGWIVAGLANAGMIWWMLSA